MSHVRWPDREALPGRPPQAMAARCEVTSSANSAAPTAVTGEVPATSHGNSRSAVDVPKTGYFAVYSGDRSASAAALLIVSTSVRQPGRSEPFSAEPSESNELPPRLVGWSDPPALPDTSAEDDGKCGSTDSDERLSFYRDFKTAPTWLSDDLRSLATWENAAFLSVAAGGSVLLREHVDQEVHQNIAQQGSYWGGASRVLNRAGESVVHVPLLAGLYSYSLYTQDAELHDLALTFVASYKFTAISTLALQYATDTRHGHYGGLNMVTDSGFPSMPASTSFALAAVVEEKFGWKAGVPAYVGAGLIGWAGIDQQQHRVSDVVFGAALGYAIGKSIGALHYRPDARFKLIPFVDTFSGAQGWQFERQF